MTDIVKGSVVVFTSADGEGDDGAKHGDIGVVVEVWPAVDGSDEGELVMVKTVRGYRIDAYARRFRLATEEESLVALLQEGTRQFEEGNHISTEELQESLRTKFEDKE